MDVLDIMAELVDVKLHTLDTHTIPALVQQGVLAPLPGRADACACPLRLLIRCHHDVHLRDENQLPCIPSRNCIFCRLLQSANLQTRCCSIRCTLLS